MQQRYWVILGIALILGTALRAGNLGWGLPTYHVPDESQLLRRSELVTSCPPRWGASCIDPPTFLGNWLFFVYPHSQLYFLNTTLEAAGLADSATSPDATRDERARIVADRILIGRWLTLSFGVATIFATFLTAAILFDGRTASVAALLLAVIPYHAAYSHIVNVDIPTALWTTCSLLFAALATRRSEFVLPFMAAGFFGGLAAATKYPGVLILSASATAVALAATTAPTTPSRVGLMDRAKKFLIRATTRSVAVAVGAVLGFALGCPHCVLQPANFLRSQNMTQSIHKTALVGAEVAPSATLPAGATLATLKTNPQASHEFIQTLAFLVSWPVLLLSVLGLGLAIRRKNREILLLIVPLVSFVGFFALANHSPPRYYLAVAPILAIAAAFVVSKAPERTRTAPIAWLSTAGTLLFSTLMTISFVNNFTTDDRHELTEFIEDTTARRYGPIMYQQRAIRPKVAILSPYLGYDAIKSIAPGRTTRYIQINPTPRAVIEHAPQYIVLSTPARVRYLRTTTWNRDLVKQLDSGELGYNLAKTIPARFFGDILYGADDIDPFAGWVRGRIGFRLYEYRTGQPPRLEH